MSDEDKNIAHMPTEKELAIADEQIDIIALSKGLASDGETPYWAYILVPPSKYEAFINAEDPVDLEDYGTIIRAGEGEEPPEHVKREMEVQLGADHSIEEQILEMSERIYKEHELRTKYGIAPRVTGHDEED